MFRECFEQMFKQVFVTPALVFRDICLNVFENFRFFFRKMFPKDFQKFLRDKSFREKNETAKYGGPCALKLKFMFHARILSHESLISKQNESQT